MIYAVKVVLIVVRIVSFFCVYDLFDDMLLNFSARKRALLGSSDESIRTG